MRRRIKMYRWSTSDTNSEKEKAIKEWDQMLMNEDKEKN